MKNVKLLVSHALITISLWPCSSMASASCSAQCIGIDYIENRLVDLGRLKPSLDSTAASAFRELQEKCDFKVARTGIATTGMLVSSLSYKGSFKREYSSSVRTDSFTLYDASFYRGRAGQRLLNESESWMREARKIDVSVHLITQKSACSTVEDSVVPEYDGEMPAQG